MFKTYTENKGGMREQKEYHVAKKIEELKEITNKKTHTSTFTPETERITVHEKSCHQFESLLKLENVNILTLWHYRPKVTITKTNIGYWTRS